MFEAQHKTEHDFLLFFIFVAVTNNFVYLGCIFTSADEKQRLII